MADVTLLRDESVPATLRFRYRDMGDGTHALVQSPGRIGAGDAYIGHVGVDQVTVAVIPVITAGAYVADDALGGRMEFGAVASVNGGKGAITKVVIVDDADQAAPVDIVFFDRPFAATADNAPFDPTDADLQNCLGWIDIANTDYSSFTDNAVAAKSSGLRMPFPFVCAAGRMTLFAQMVVRGAPTYVAIDDLTVKITVERYR